MKWIESNPGFAPTEWECPHCHETVEMGDDRYEYCPHCGEKVQGFSYAEEED